MSCLTNYMIIDLIATLIISSLVGVCIIQIHKMYNYKNNEAKNINKKTVYTFEEDIILRDKEDGPIWF